MIVAEQPAALRRELDANTDAILRSVARMDSAEAFERLRGDLQTLIRIKAERMLRDWSADPRCVPDERLAALFAERKSIIDRLVGAEGACRVCYD
jgi:hypothetical protein